MNPAIIINKGEAQLGNTSLHTAGKNPEPRVAQSLTEWL